MTALSQRQRDPQPLSRGGEVAFVALATVVLLLGIAALTGLGVAAAVFGGGWVWPNGQDHVGPVLEGLLTGHPGRALSPRQQLQLPSSALMYVCVGVCELLLLAGAAVCAVAFARYRRPAGVGRGMATRGEARQVLGASRLRQAAPLLRPDLSKRPGHLAEEGRL
jgi:hypothetical protein